MDIKLIGIDLDDTLLNTKKEISDFDAEMVNYANSKGIKCVATTGRPLAKNTIMFYKQMGIYEEKQYMIAFNGAAIYDIFSKECLFNDGIVAKEIKEIHNFFKDFNGGRYFYTDGIVNYDVWNKYVQLEEDYNGIVLRKTDISGISDDIVGYKYMYASDPEDVKEVFSKIPKWLFDKYSIMITMPCFIEVFDKNVDKYNAIMFLAKKHDLHDEQIMAIGDSMNDYKMIKNSYFGVAMKNAIPKVKEVAKFITDTNDLGGVGKAIKKALMEE